MVKNYFLLFIRNLRRQKLFSFVNLLGLTVSLVSTLLIYLYVRHEFSFDRFHSNVDRIYRVNQTFIWGENSDNQFASTGPGVATALAAELPEVELMTSIHTRGNFIISYVQPDGQVVAFEEKKVLVADTNFFRMFNFPMTQGDPMSALRQSNTMVMTASTARKYFGDANPVGKMVRLGGETPEDGQQTYEVTGVVEDTPDNSYIEFDVLLSMNSFPVIKKLYWSWVWTQLETFVRLAPNANIDLVRQKLVTIPKRYAEETLQRAMNMSYDEYVKSGKKWELFLQPMAGIHLPPSLVFNRLNDSGNLKVIYSFIGAAIFIVLLSCVNFMNLSMAQFTRRIREASIRKILGLRREQLGINYFVEALIFCFIALAIALGIAQVALPSFNLLTGKNLRIDFVNDPAMVLGLTGITVLMAIVSSGYPAAFLSGFHPVEAIKGKLRSGREGRGFRNGLVVFQFSISIILIVCTGIVSDQLRYFSDKDLGFNKENLIVIPHLENMKDGESFAKAVATIPGVTQSTWCTSVPPTIYGGDTFSAEGMNGKTFPLNYTTGDENYVTTLSMRLKVGRNFSADRPGDHDRAIINEATARRIGWKIDESIIGRKLEYHGTFIEVIGVVADFNYWSLATPIEPIAIFHIKGHVLTESHRLAVAKITGQDSRAWEQTINEIQKKWKIHAGDLPFQYEFVDQAFAETFKTARQFEKVLTVMSTLAILIASLGLLGIIIYSLEHRSKEIGIRKVAGASVLNILALITRGYARLILIAFVIGAPLAYWLMYLWLQDFAYRIKPSPWIFVLTGATTLGVAVLITAYHSVKAALTNPVNVLREE